MFKHYLINRREDRAIEIRGGKARLNGVEFYTEDFCVTAVRKKNGNIYIDKFTLQESPKSAFFDTLLKIPFVRGITLWLQMVLFGGFWKKIFVLTIIGTVVISAVFMILGYIFPSVETFLYSQADIPAAFQYLKPFLLGFIFAGAVIFRFTPITRYHGAEHKAYNTFLNGKTMIINHVRTESCISNDCGTNIVVNLIVLLIIGDLLSLPLVINVVLSCSVSYEIAKTSNHILSKLVYPFTLLGRLGSQ